MLSSLGSASIEPSGSTPTIYENEYILYCTIYEYVADVSIEQTFQLSLFTNATQKQNGVIASKVEDFGKGVRTCAHQTLGEPLADLARHACDRAATAGRDYDHVDAVFAGLEDLLCRLVVVRQRIARIRVLHRKSLNYSL